MSTTEDYLDQLLKKASGEGNDSIGESDSELQSEENIISLEDNADEMAAEDGISLEQAMEMSVDDVLNEMENMENIDVDTMSEESPVEEPELEILETVNEPEDFGNEMLSEEAIAAMLESNPIMEPEAESVESALEETVLEEPIWDDSILGEPVLEEPVLEEAVLEEPMIEEPVLEEPIQEEPQAVNEPEDFGTGMMSEDAIAAMFASTEELTPDQETIGESEDIESGLLSDDFVSLEDGIGLDETGDGISLDDMLSGIQAEDIAAEPEDMNIMSEEIGEDIATESSGDDSILDLLNMMADDEDLKDIGDLLKSDEDSGFDISEDELFGEMPTEGDEVQQEELEEKEKKPGLFAKLFGKKKDKGSDKAATDENQQIIKEVEEEIEEEDKKAEEKEEKEEKKKKKKAKKDKKGKKKGKDGGEEQGDGEEGEAEGSKKGKKEKKKKEKKEKPPKEVIVTPKEPPLPKKPVILIMLMAASILALVLLSHKVINYQSSISKADSSFINRNYEEAYQNILGVDVKEDDEQLYDRIRVMMKLEAKYEMYLSHIEQSKYDEALNDLIMGVIKYDQYKKDAEELGIQQAFDDELALIEEQLNVVFGVDVNQAREWYNTLSALDYTETVRSVVKAAGYSVEEAVAEEDTEGNSEDLSQFGVQEVE